ncbi:cation:proton antiporter [Neorhizobium sp. DT-125]|uniref:cation:proton antiporter n=1 Tax=Neorhizobium sp. DT-125 TaxID=3396163 RepID=UPI003F1E0188
MPSILPSSPRMGALGTCRAGDQNYQTGKYDCRKIWFVLALRLPNPFSGSFDDDFVRRINASQDVIQMALHAGIASARNALQSIHAQDDQPVPTGIKQSASLGRGFRVGGYCPADPHPQAYDAHSRRGIAAERSFGPGLFAICGRSNAEWWLLSWRHPRTFFWIASGGIIVGTAVTWTIVRVKDWVSRHFGEESGSQIVISLLIPFGCYLLAEELHCSGILAAVAAGVTMSVTETSGRALPVTRIRRNTVWDMIQFAGNGMIFVLLGEQLPSIVGGAAAAVQLTGHENPWWLLAYVFAINVGLAFLRFVWVWVSLQLTLFRAGQRFARPDWRIVAAMCFAGVRGAITLAGVLTLPLTMTDGSPFPARELVIALAAAVIIISLVVATVALPLLLRGLRMPDEPSSDVEEDAALVAAAESAIAAIERRQHAMASGRKDADLYIAAAARITDPYRDRIASRQEGSAADQTRYNEVIERDLRLRALQAERPRYSTGPGWVRSEVTRQASSCANWICWRLALAADCSLRLRSVFRPVSG